MVTTTFREAAPILAAAGFETVPIKLGCKAPVGERWQVPRPVAAHLPRCANCGVGILSRWTPAADLDVRDIDLLQELHGLAERELGLGRCYRVGLAPKRLIPYRTAAPFPKITTAAYRLPGDDSDAKPHRVEILSDGQQFVAYGIHPETRCPYVWPDDDLLSVLHDELTEIDAARAHGFIQAAEELLAKAGKLAEPANRPVRSTGPWEPGKPGRSVRSLREAGDVLGTLRRIPNADLPYDDWLRVAYGLKAAFGEEHGWGLFATWSASSSKNLPLVTEHLWRSIRPTRAGWRYLIRLAGEMP